MMIKVISALENGKTCHRYYNQPPLPFTKYLYNEHYCYNCVKTHTLKSIKNLNTYAQSLP